MEKIEPGILREHAQAAAKKSSAPYSNYKVGAAVLCGNGKIFKGCNVESSSYGLSVCAERNALAAAIVNGCSEIKALAIFSRNGAKPCGACRQIIWDICGNIPIYIFDEAGGEELYYLSNLLPEPFDKDILKGE